MSSSLLRIFTRDVAATIDARLYGGFIEHLGRAVYTGIYEPGHPTSDADGLRGDVIELIRELDMPIVRYPGGNFVSAYRWEDGVGPRSERPRRLDLAWNTTETNQFGTDDFMQWCRTAGTAPMMAVNLGTRGVQEAVDLLEYCNHPGGTSLSDQRIRNGSRDPHDVRLWCLGNEMDGPWQTGHKTALEYGRIAAEAARAMRQFDPSLELVLCGSSGRSMPTWMDWERTVLEEAYESADYISLHCYLAESSAKGDADYLTLPLRMEAQIRETIAVCDFVKARGRFKKTMFLSFDEWNVWDSTRHVGNFPRWSEAPGQLEQEYTMKDALVFGGMLLSLLRHAGRIRIACVAQLVNVIAPILTTPGGVAWRQTIFYPYLHASRHGRGVLLETRLSTSSEEHAEWGEVPSVEAVVTHNPANGKITIFALNRSPQDQPFQANLDEGAWRVLEHSVLADDDLEAANTQANPDRVTPKPAPVPHLEGRRLQTTLRRFSWNMIRLCPSQA